MIEDKWSISSEYKKTSIEILTDNLSALRARIDITQEKLANILGVSRQTYYSFETKKREMVWTTYMAILFFFESIKETSEMIRELRIYPIDLVMRFNGDLSVPRLE